MCEIYLVNSPTYKKNGLTSEKYLGIIRILSSLFVSETKNILDMNFFEYLF